MVSFSHFVFVLETNKHNWKYKWFKIFLFKALHCFLTWKKKNKQTTSDY